MIYLKSPELTSVRLLTLPVIIPMIIPLVLFDLCIEVYHNTCFRVYQIPLIKRNKYIKIDRHKLKYLTIWQKFFCVYCGYANGLIHYACIIIAKTEEYWCGIQHKKNKKYIAPRHHKKFLKYGDSRGVRELKKK